MNKPNRIFIIGHSGAGKGVLAKGVAEKLGWKFIDADFSLAPSIGRDIEEIIGNEGTDFFQRTLRDILSYQLTQKNIVVTTDDSIICSEENRKMLSTQFTVYLQVSTKVQLERMGHNRPLLPLEDYATFLSKLHKERNAFYEQSGRIMVNSDDNDLESHILTVVNALSS